MSAIRIAAVALGLAATASPALSVGLGPLTQSGATRSDRKGFYLTLVNPYPAQTRFRLYSVEWDNDRPVPRVRIPLAQPILGANARRRILAIDTGLVPGEHHQFRVCAERADLNGEGLIHARVCSKLIARRVP